MQFGALGFGENSLVKKRQLLVFFLQNIVAQLKSHAVIGR
ncbi:hypothetical protein BC643_1221 [Mangrovibacterium diazotrophicum]|uniref:Uncharacterized protein n=1 Tax=Mangrovibacterium diazotrophicum TaxID=1261403 RepID=A0A419W610_9BACT|nr:hypothetical protein BC643_1221 [Mangrovibacterium diazotrophicum]